MRVAEDVGVVDELLGKPEVPELLKKKSDGRRFRCPKRPGALRSVAAHVEGVEGVTMVETPTS